MDLRENVARGLAWIRENHPDVVLTTEGLDMDDPNACIASQLPGGYMGLLDTHGLVWLAEHGFHVTYDMAIDADMFMSEVYAELANEWHEAIMEDGKQ